MSQPILSVVVDDRDELPRFADAFADVGRFGDLLRQRRSLFADLSALVTGSGLLAPRRLPEDALALTRGLASDVAAGGRLFLLLPGYLAATVPEEDARQFLRELARREAPASLGTGGAASGAVLVDEHAIDEYLELPAERAEAWRLARAASLPAVDDGLRLADLREPTALLEFLSGGFAARHFNELRHERGIVVKRSRDVRKIRREHAFYGLLPEHLQAHFVPPFGYEEDDDGASYRMHRLLVPDLAVQWIHHAFSPEQFGRLLEQLLRFVDARDRRTVDGATGRAVAAELYDVKLRTRTSDFLADPVGRRVDGLLAASGVDGGIEGLVARYDALRGRLERGRAFDELVVTHGDLCFSNVLFDPAARSVHLIDPRGADHEHELYSDPYYDLAKLSHSVLGGYDLIVAEQIRVGLRDDLGLQLVASRTPDPALGVLFRAALAERGVDLRLLRLYEASLFLSMLPLHVEAPTRVLALALRGAQILGSLEGEPAARSAPSR